MVSCANAALTAASTQPFDCLILDRMLPGRDGLDILADLRRTGAATPVLLLTARDAIEDRVVRRRGRERRGQR